MPINTGEKESDMLFKHVTLLVTLHLTFGRRKVEGGGRREEGLSEQRLSGVTS